MTLERGTDHDIADGGDSDGVAVASSVVQGEDIPAPPIRCRYANFTSVGAACGAFTLEHHRSAAAAGQCCATFAFEVLA